MSSSFHNADKRTHQKIMFAGLLFCAAFENNYVLIKADKPVRTAGTPLPAK
jgi:hypothetical protein